MDDGLKKKLNALHSELLTVHKALLDFERGRYEGQFQKIESPGEFLNLLLNDPFFGWLRILSGLIAQVDEFVEVKGEKEAGAGEAYIAEAKLLLDPAGSGAFQKEYGRAVGASGEVAAAHAAWLRLYGTLGQGSKGAEGG